MATSINSPAMSNAIRVDIPALNEIVNALAKMDPSLLTDLQEGTKRIVEGTSGWEIQQLQGNTWTTLNKFNIDAQTVDGYSAATDTVANTIPVRNASGKLPGDITGNAATATTAGSLSDTLDVTKGGTGGTSPETARENLGVAPTNHASTSGDFGASSATEFGHSKASSTSPKALGTASVGTETTSFARGDHVHPATTANASVLGMVKLSDSTASTSDASTGIAASPKAVKAAMDTATSAASAASDASAAATTAQTTADSALAKANTSVQTSGNQTVAGEKTFTSNPVISGPSPAIALQDTDVTKAGDTLPTSNQISMISFNSKDGTTGANQLGALVCLQTTNNDHQIYLQAVKPEKGATTSAKFGVAYNTDGTAYAFAPTPAATANNTHVATTAWVKANAATNVSVTTVASLQAERKMQIAGYTGISTTKMQEGVNADDYQDNTGSGSFSNKRAEMRTTNTIGAGTYTMQKLLVELAKRAHTHQTGAWIVKSNCNCDCDCCDAY